MIILVFYLYSLPGTVLKIIDFLIEFVDSYIGDFGTAQSCCTVSCPPNSIMEGCKVIKDKGRW
jgi:hypothetical protein